MSRFFPLLCLLLITAVQSHAALPPQVIYWRSVLPNVLMPRAISDLLSPETTAHGRPTRHGYRYDSAATESQIHDDPNMAFFLREEDLHPGTKMTLQLGNLTYGAPFIPRSTADSIPFSLSRFPEILARFSWISPGSLEAKAMKETLLECEEKSEENVNKYCATSLESMVDFSIATLRTTSLLAASTTVSSKTDPPRQQYTIEAGGVRMVANGELLVCHAQSYAYAVFYCHTTQSAKAYAVKMAGTDSTTVEAVAVCHTNTAAWNPKQIAFQVLKVKPGKVPICHLLPQDNVVWSHKAFEPMRIVNRRHTEYYHRNPIGSLKASASSNSEGCLVLESHPELKNTSHY